ncbi:MAG: glycosyltransferase family A protein [Ferruginibacter sp.]
MVKLQNKVPSVSVIIPNYNHARFLPQRIESVLEQSFRNFECIILDDASTDNSKTVIEQYAAQDARIAFYPSPANSGSPFIQWNKGVKLAKNDLVWIAESDDHCTPGLLQSLVDCHLQNPAIGLAYCQSNRMNEAGNITGSWKTYTDDLDNGLFAENFTMEGTEFIKRFLVYKNVIPNASAVVFRKSFFNNAGYADESLKTNSDWLTWLKIGMQAAVSFVAHPHNMFRQHEASVIAKYSVGSASEYKEKYDGTMRQKFEDWCKQHAMHPDKKITKVNQQYISYENGNRGLHLFQQGKFLQAFPAIAKASVSPHLTLGYLRRLMGRVRQ